MGRRAAMSMHSTTSSPVRSPTRRPSLWASDAISTHQRSSGIVAHLGKRGGGERLRVEALEELIDIETELVLDDLERSLGGEARHLVLQLAQLLEHLMRDAIRETIRGAQGRRHQRPSEALRGTQGRHQRHSEAGPLSSLSTSTGSTSTRVDMSCPILIKVGPSRMRVSRNEAAILVRFSTSSAPCSPK